MPTDWNALYRAATAKRATTTAPSDPLAADQRETETQANRVLFWGSNVQPYLTACLSLDAEQEKEFASLASWWKTQGITEGWLAEHGLIAAGHARLQALAMLRELKEIDHARSQV